MNNFDGKDLYSYDHEANKIENGETSFDLNSFSSHSKGDISSNSPEKSSGRAKKKKKQSTKKQKILKAFLTVFLVGLITFSLVVGAFMFYAFTMIDPTMDVDLNNLELNFTTTIYVDKGNGKYSEYSRLHGEFNRIWVDYDEEAAKDKEKGYDGIPYNLAMAFVAIEDKGFNDHNGVDWKRTVGALINEIVPIYSSRQGGSTITQQLVKNLTDDREQEASRKVREIMRARYLEQHYAKPTILECYLNTIPMGNGTYGVEVAANYYFGKTVSELTISECASLASITKAPSNYAPYNVSKDKEGNKQNFENNLTRRNTVLYEMYDQGYITKEEYEKAKSEKLKVVAEKEVISQSDVNSYFVDALINQVTEDLSEKYGYDKTYASQLFYNGGYKIYATVDQKMQKSAEKIFQDKQYNIKNSSGAKLQAGITVMDYQGNVKALVGGLGKKTTNRGYNNATDAVRQPGSTMKPIAAYAPAIEKNLIHYSSILNDTKTNYNGWTPKNWYGGYWGNVTTQYALERSINSIPVYLVNKMTPQASYDFLTQKLGITTLGPQDINLSPLGMGGTNKGLTTLESAAAFATFGNGGKYYEPAFYSKVTNQAGEVVLEKKKKANVAMGEDTATIMNHLLRTVVYGKNGTGTAAASYVPKMKIYAKTGTSNDQNDLWFVGGTPYYVGSCWCGFKKMQPIPSAHSGIALKLWGNVMKEAHEGLEVKEFTDSAYTVKKKYCTKSGLLATEGCPSTAVGWYKKNHLPESCTSHAGKLAADDKKDDKDTASSEAE